MKRFQHEDLEVYALTTTFIASAISIAERVPRQRWFIADQLVRAATSVGLNIAEGAAEFTPAEKARFYRMSRRSAAECAAAMAVPALMNTITHEEAEAQKVVLRKVAGMLTRMVQSVEAREPSPRARARPRARAEERSARARPRARARADEPSPRARARPRARAEEPSPRARARPRARAEDAPQIGGIEA